MQEFQFPAADDLDAQNRDPDPHLDILVGVHVATKSIELLKNLVPVQTAGIAEGIWIKKIIFQFNDAVRCLSERNNDIDVMLRKKL